MNKPIKSIRYCWYCGKKYIPKDNRFLFCSISCKIKSKKDVHNKAVQRYLFRRENVLKKELGNLL